jgi:hypothetical protein
MRIFMITRIIDSLCYRKRKYYSKFSESYWKVINKFLVSDKRNTDRKKILFVFVPMWGSQYVDLFFEYTMPSLMQSKNFPDISSNNKRIIICFYTKSIDAELIKRKMNNYNCGYEYKIYNDYYFKDLGRGLMLNFFIHMLEKCVSNNALMLLALPDFIYSNGSISNLFKLSDGKGVSVAVPHPRVSYECIEEGKINIKNLLKSGISSSMLVKMAGQCKHSSFSFSDELMDKNSTSDGISTRKLNYNCLAVTHNLPNVCLLSPIKDDVSFFKRRISFNDIDHLWPNMLLRQSRLKVVGSSNIAFMIELTYDNDKIPKLRSDNKFNDQYDGVRPFCNYANTIVSSWDLCEKGEVNL